MLTRAIIDYDRRVGQPRHQDNLKVAKEHTTALADVLESINKVKGGITTVKWLGGILTAACTVAAIILSMKH